VQAKAGRALPLAIMTSDDTHARTEALLKDNAYWGASANQITLIKQEKVACLSGAHVRRLPHLRLAAASLLLLWLYSGGRQCYSEDARSGKGRPAVVRYAAERVAGTSLCVGGARTCLLTWRGVPSRRQ
jgi:hypothetical protein